MTSNLIYFTILKFFCIIIPLLIAVAYFTTAERKIMGSIQKRKGPNVIGYLGLLQPLADGLKLFVKETIIPVNANKKVFLIAPCIAFVLSLLNWAVIPLDQGIVISNINLGIIYILTISSLNVYGVLLAGWASNSKYAFLGSVRSAAQMISYELPMGFSVLCVALCSGSFNLSSIVLAQKNIWFLFPLFPVFIVFYISALAETNRHPFDLPEAEAELVSGYNVEYSSMTFALFFLAEYANMLLISTFGALLFLGGWLSPVDNVFFNFFGGTFWLSVKILVGVVFFVITRATLPRYRYDQLMSLGWKTLLPLTLSYFIFVAGILIGFNYLP